MDTIPGHLLPVGHDRQSRFDTMPGDIKVPPARLYPSKPVQRMSQWLVRFAVEGEAWQAAWKHDERVWAYDSTDAVLRARAAFYGAWATPEARQRLPLRVLECMQVGV